MQAPGAHLHPQGEGLEDVQGQAEPLPSLQKSLGSNPNLISKTSTNLQVWGLGSAWAFSPRQFPLEPRYKYLRTD